MEDKRQFTLWYYIGVVVLLFAVQTYFARPHVGALTYSDFKTLVQAGKVSDVSIGTDVIEATVDLRGVEALLPAAAIDDLREQRVIEPPGTAGESAQNAASGEGTGHRVVARRSLRLR